MRDVIVYKDKNLNEENFRGKFHQWGVNFVEFESSPGNYTTAIIELETGNIVTESEINLIRFVN